MWYSHERHPEVAERIIQAIGDRDDAPSIQAILCSQASLEEAGFVSPVWSDFASGRAEAEPDHEEFVEPNQPRVGWQSKAAREVCEGCDIVQSDHAPQAGVAQGIFNGDLIKRRVGHQVELEEELEEEVERRVRRDHSRDKTQVRMHG